MTSDHLLVLGACILWGVMGYLYGYDAGLRRRK